MKNRALKPDVPKLEGALCESMGARFLSGETTRCEEVVGGIRSGNAKNMAEGMPCLARFGEEA